jgi:hypothetical protein
VERVEEAKILAKEDRPCAYHTVLNGMSATHSNLNCHWVDKLKDDPEAGFKGKAKKAKGKSEAKDASDSEDGEKALPKQQPKGKKPYPQHKESFHVFLGIESVKASKAALRELNAMLHAVP